MSSTGLRDPPPPSPGLSRDPCAPDDDPSRALWTGLGPASLLARRRESGIVHALEVVLADVPIGSDGDESLARFQRAAEVLARVDAHPGVGRGHAYGVANGNDDLAPRGRFAEGEPVLDQARRP